MYGRCVDVLTQCHACRGGYDLSVMGLRDYVIDT